VIAGSHDLNKRVKTKKSVEVKVQPDTSESTSSSTSSGSSQEKKPKSDVIKKSGESKKTTGCAALALIH
jgi:hypothetical protein